MDICGWDENRENDLRDDFSISYRSVKKKENECVIRLLELWTVYGVLIESNMFQDQSRNV